MKGHKGEGATQSQMKGAIGAGERGPLFPRLHVNETGKPGPKGPPRNKMALYEQFTVPSHRFVPSQTSASTVYQQQYISHDLGYPYLRYYMPAVPYANTSHRGQVYAQASHGTSSSGVTNGSGVTNEDSSRKFLRHHKVGKSSPCKVSRGSTEASADSSELKGKDAKAPAQSSLSNLIEESTNSVHDVSPDTERPTVTDIRESLQEALSTVEVEMECPIPGGQSCSHPRVPISMKSTCMTDEGQLQQAAQHSVDKNLTKQTKGVALVESPGQSCLQTGSAGAECKHETVTQGMTSRTHCTTLSETSIEPASIEESLTMIASNQSFPSSANRAVADPGSALKGDETLSSYGHTNALKNSITDVEKADDSIGGLSVAALAKPDDESSEELKNIQNKNSKASQSLECRTRKGYHSDDLVMPSASFYSVPIIKPKSVIHAIGQQQFWKARKTLLRQQQIFSDQVFQLHKLIKVQQLLAKTPGTLIDEEMQFETIKECNVAAPLAKGAINIGEDAHNVSLDVKKGSKDTSCEAGGQPRNKWEHIQVVGKVGIGSSKLMPEFHSSGISAWGYPSLGHWVGVMAAQGQPFGYQPFAGTFPPGSPFGLQYGSASQGSVSPMISLGIPYCDQRQELPAEMGSNYGPPTAFKHEESVTVSGNSSHVSNSLQGPWCNSLNQQRMHPAPPGEDVPSGSGVSVNKSSASVQVVNTCGGSGLSYQWDRTCQSGPSNTDSFKSYAHQSESSSPSIATRLNCQKSYFTPTTSVANMLGFSNTDVGRLAQNSDLGSAYGSCSSDQYDNNRQGAEEKEELNTSFLRCSKNQKDDVCLPVDDQVSDADERLSDINYSALELFPLVPFLSSIGQNRKKAAEEELGRVIRAVPRRAIAASESAAGILLSLQRERQK